MHHGVGGNFYRASFQDKMGDELLNRGVAVLRVNNRGHDLAYNAPPPHRRLGAAFETVDDCRHDWRAWIDLAAERGYQRILVWGHSLGAVKTIYYLAKEKDPRVARAVASSPPRFSHSSFLARHDGKQFADAVEDAKQLAKSGKPDSLFAIEIPTSALMTTKTYFDKYGVEERYDIIKHLPDTVTPLYVTVGGLEGREGQADRYAFGGLDGLLTDAAKKSNSWSYRLIDGADHFYSGVEGKLWSAVETWLAN